MDEAVKKSKLKSMILSAKRVNFLEKKRGIVFWMGLKCKIYYILTALEYFYENPNGEYREFNSKLSWRKR